MIVTSIEILTMQNKLNDYKLSIIFHTMQF